MGLVVAPEDRSEHPEVMRSAVQHRRASGELLGVRLDGGTA